MMRAMPGRTVTLVVCDAAGTIQGEITPFEVATPWWQDMEPVSERFPSLAILRLLVGSPAPGQPRSDVRYLAEPIGTTANLRLAPSATVGYDHELRMPWARPGGPAADLDWAASVVTPAGPPTQHRTWNLSAIWSIPTEEGRVWLKCVPGFFGHEAAVLRSLGGRGVPELLASDRHRMLLAGLGGDDGYGATTTETCRLIDHLIALQLQTTADVPQLLAAGVPDGRWAALLRDLRAIVDRRAPGCATLRDLMDTAGARVEAIEACGLPDVLVHGDAHRGNARVGIEPPVWFDWGDSRIGSPILDLAVLNREDDSVRAHLERHWLDAWAKAVPGSDPYTAWRLAQPLAQLRMAVVYQMFLDSIEPSERVYHVDDVELELTQASDLVRAAGPLR